MESQLQCCSPFVTVKHNNAVIVIALSRFQVYLDKSSHSDSELIEKIQHIMVNFLATTHGHTSCKNLTTKDLIQVIYKGFFQYLCNIKEEEIIRFKWG